jgi:hypothetical protein
MRRRKGLTGSAGTGFKTAITNSSSKSSDGSFCLKDPELPSQTPQSLRFSPIVTGEETLLVSSFGFEAEVDIIHNVVNADENGVAFYFDGKNNKQNKHSLNDCKVMDGVPALNWKGNDFTDFVTPGGVGIKEFGGAPSDLIRFLDDGSRVGAGSLLFYSDKESPPSGKNNDAGVSTNDANAKDELELDHITGTDTLTSGMRVFRAHRIYGEHHCHITLSTETPR